MDYRFGKDAFGRQEGEGGVSEGEAKLGRGEQREGSCAGSGRVLEGSRLGGGGGGTGGEYLSGRCSPLARILRTSSRYWHSSWWGREGGWGGGRIVGALVEGFVSATVATGVVWRGGAAAAALGSVSATVATAEVSRVMAETCN